MVTFEILIAADGRYCWKLVLSSGEVMAVSPGAFDTVETALRSVVQVQGSSRAGIAAPAC